MKKKELRRKDLFSKEFNKFSIKEASAIDGINYLKKIGLSEKELVEERRNLAKQFNCIEENISYGDIYWRLLNKKGLEYFSTDSERYAWNQVAMADFVHVEGKDENAVEILIMAYKTLLRKENIYSYMDFESEVALEMNILEYWQNIYLDIIISGLRSLDEDIKGNFVLNEISNKYPEFLSEIENKFKEFKKNIKENEVKSKSNVDQNTELKKIKDVDKEINILIDYNNSRVDNKSNRGFIWVIIFLFIVWIIFW